MLSLHPCAQIYFHAMLPCMSALLAASPSPPSSPVYLMRHCARSTFLPDMYGGQTPRYLANYSDGGELPDWGVPPTLCTARGRSIVVGQGRSLRAEVLSRIGTDHLKVVYDAAATRDNTTALDFLTGLGLPSLKRMGAAEVFDPPEAWCPLLTEEQKRNAVSAQLGAVPRPKGYTDRIAALQKILGRGVAPPMQSMPDVVSGGDVGWIGGSNAASSWIEAMLSAGRLSVSTIVVECTGCNPPLLQTRCLVCAPR